MFRLFIIIYALIVATVVAVVFSMNMLAEVLMAKVENDSFDAMYTAPFAILDDAVQGLEGEALELRLDELRTLFKYPVDLVPLSSVDTEKSRIDRLEQGRIISSQVDGSHILYRKSTIDGWLWTFMITLNDYEYEVALGTGPLKLLKQKLQGMTKQQQETALRDLQTDTGYPIELGDPAHFNLSEDERAALQKNLVIVRQPGEPGQKFYIQLDESNTILQTTVPGWPWYSAYLTPVLLFFALLALALFSLFWLWPLWRDLRSLKLASSQIAAGNLDARVSSGRASMIKSVLSGFNSMADSSQKMIVSQKELTDAVSHELRTPLARMKFGLEMLGDADESNEQQRHLKDMRMDVDELNSLVDELLSFAREDNHSIANEYDVLSTHEMTEWLQKQLTLAGRGHATIQTHLHVEPGPDVSFFSKSLARAVSNGLQNALRFASTSVTLTFAVKDQDYVLRIEDDGPGIPQEFRPNIFEPFRRADGSRNRESGGFGLGLAIVKRIAEGHGGNAKIADSPLGGNQLEIRWPVDNQF